MITLQGFSARQPTWKIVGRIEAQYAYFYYVATARVIQHLCPKGSVNNEHYLS